MSHRGASDKRQGGWGTDAGRHQRRRLRPTVAMLEGRTLLSVFTVTNTDDSVSEMGTLRWAVNQADSNPGVADTITFDGKVFKTPKTIALLPSDGGQLTLTNPATTTIIGPGANLLSVSGGGTSRVFGLDPGASVALSGLTITGGNADVGGGVDNNGGTLTLATAVISDNSASDQGGGLFNANGGTATLTNATISGNSAQVGGGLDNYVTPQRLAMSTLTLTNATISGNSAPTGFGGGLANIYGIVTLTNATVTGNTAKNDAAGLENDRGTLTLTNATVSGNSGAFEGGGLDNFYGTLTLTNATVSGNSASSSGGGLYNHGIQSGHNPNVQYSSKLTLTNSTISGNSAAFGGGLDNAGGTVSLTNAHR